MILLSRELMKKWHVKLDHNPLCYPVVANRSE